MNNITIYLEQRPAIFENSLMGNLAYTLGERRSHHPWKVAVPSRASHELIPILASTSITPSRSSVEPKVGFIFTGQGAQWHAMGRELMDVYPAFASTMRLIDEYLVSNFQVLRSRIFHSL
jgi:acyl transferase domain-containing protein